MASPGRSTNAEEGFSLLKKTENSHQHIDPGQKTSGDKPSIQHQENFPVTLPSHPPSSPIPTHFPFPPPPECHLANTGRTPGSARQSVLSCPISRGFACTPRTPNIPIPDPNHLHTNLLQSLSWDNYRQSPTFSQTGLGWTGFHTGYPLLNNWTAERTSLTSSTDPNGLEVSEGESWSNNWIEERASLTRSTDLGLEVSGEPCSDNIWIEEETNLTRRTDSLGLEVSADSLGLEVSGVSLSDIERLRGDSEGVRKIQLVSTQCSDLSQLSSPEISGILTASLSEESLVEDLDSLESPKMDTAQANRLILLQQDLEDEVSDMDPDLITKDEAPQVEKDLTRIWEKKNSFRNGVRYLVAPLPSGDGDRVKWEEACKVMMAKVINHKKQVRGAVERLCPTVKLTEFQLKSLDLQEQTLKESRLARQEQEQSSKKGAWAEAKVRLQTFRDEYNGLVAEINSDQTAWKDRHDMTITKNMQDLQHWKKTFEKIVTNYREYERIVATFGEENPGDDELATAQEEFEAVKESFENAKENIEAADRDRELFSTQKQVGEKLDYPTFTGAAHEDFVKFHDKVVKQQGHQTVYISVLTDCINKMCLVLSIQSDTIKQ